MWHPFKPFILMGIWALVFVVSISLFILTMIILVSIMEAVKSLGALV